MTMRLAPLDPASLRTRLVLIPTVILFIGMAATIGFVLGGARARVQAEIDSGMRLGRILVQDALRDVAESADPSRALTRFEGSLPQVRHVQFEFSPGTVPSEKPVPRPWWFFRLLAPRSQREVFPVTVRGLATGFVVMRSNPSNEIAEVWSEIQLLAGVLGGLWALITVTIFRAVGLSLRPLRTLAEAFDRLEHGHFQPLPAIHVAELRRIGTRFNSLGRTLERVTSDNHFLIDRMMSLQEAERKELARELHDEFGPALFGIRADASCIARWTTEGSARAHDIEERARSIAELADGIQKITYQMLDRLRPLVLEQMGLREALRQLVGAWQERYPDVAWSLRLSPAIAECDELVGLTLYRAVQECLTNVVRHARATVMTVTIDQLPCTDFSQTAGDAIHISARDDGRGLPADFRFGYGLLGMAERIRRLRGSLAVRNIPEGGTLVEIVIPCPAAGEGE